MIHVEDNFFKDPYSIRKLALRQTYECDRNHPGSRSSVPTNISDNIRSKIEYIVKDSTIKLESSHFQYITKEYSDGLFHRDPYRYICIVYLSLDPPEESGTEVCDYKQVPDNFFMPYIRRRKYEFHGSPHNLIKRYTYARLRRWKNSHYKVVMKVPNQFNRAIIFPATSFHRSQYSFGTSIENARLTFVSFVDRL